MANSDSQHAIAIKRGGGLRNKLMIAVLVLVCAGGLLFFWWSGTLDTAAREMLAAARQEASELQAQRPSVKPENNAAGPFQGACSRYAKPADESLELSEKDAPRDFKSTAVKTYLKENAACLAELEKALALPACDWGSDYNAGLEGQKLPSVVENRSAGRLLLVAARNDAAEGRTGPALRKLALVLRVADPVSAEPQLISRMVRCVAETKFSEGLTGLLNDSEPAKADLEKLLTVLSKHADSRGDMSGCFKAEKVLLAVSVARAVSGETSAYQSPALIDDMALRSWWWRYSGNFVKDMELMNSVQDTIIKALSEPYPQALDAVEKQVTNPATLPGWALICRVAIANPANAAKTDCEALARLRMAQVLIGLRLHRLAKLAYPVKLDEVGATIGSVPVDPFTGKDFGYSKTEEGCKLWSAGRNRKDDDGDTKKDVVLELKQ